MKYTSRTPVSSGWRTVLYSHEDQIRLLRSLIGFVGAACPAPGGPVGTQEFAARTQALVPFLASAVAYLKHPAFEEEREVRSVFAVDDLKPTPVQFRASRLGVTPYVSCAVGGEPRDENRGLALTTASKTRLPVTEVMIGPTADREAARRGVMAILEARGYKAVEVSWSDSPYR